MPLFTIRTPSGWGLGEIPDLIPFCRWAARAGFAVVNLLPVNEVTGGETSPYSAATAFALDPAYLGLDACEDFAAVGGQATLAASERAQLDHLAQSPNVDWEGVRGLKQRSLALAFAHFRQHEWGTGSTRAAELAQFAAQQSGWLDDYVLFRALHDRQPAGWQQWPEPLRRRDKVALEHAGHMLGDTLLYLRWCQWLLDGQWRQARAAARSCGVALMGDLPFVVSGDSADVWSHQGDFHLDRRVGTPPDAFSQDGQDWGLPVFNWQAMGEGQFAWMRARAARAASLYSLYRVDHVIGLYRTYYRTASNDAGFTPATETEQLRLGETVLGLFHDSGEVVAEDLGLVPDFLRHSLSALGIPGYRVLRWERDGEVYRDPATWPELSVATTGTHDIETNAEWWDALTVQGRTAAGLVPGLGGVDAQAPFSPRVRDALLAVVYNAPSDLAIIPIQDALGSRARINVPGTVGPGNWTYRLPDNVGDLESDHATTGRLAALARNSGRETVGRETGASPGRL